MPDAPNPDPASGHEHLFAPVDVDRALLELRRPNNPRPLRAGCVLCGEVLELTVALADTPTARRAAVRDRAARRAAAAPPVPPPPAPATWNGTPDRPPAWALDVAVEP